MNCLIDYLTDDCKNCLYWKDGSDGSVGCAIPLPINYCPSFRKTEEEENAYET